MDDREENGIANPPRASGPGYHTRRAEHRRNWREAQYCGGDSNGGTVDHAGDAVDPGSDA